MFDELRFDILAVEAAARIIDTMGQMLKDTDLVNRADVEFLGSKERVSLFMEIRYDRVNQKPYQLSASAYALVPNVKEEILFCQVLLPCDGDKNFNEVLEALALLVGMNVAFRLAPKPNNRRN